MPLKKIRDEMRSDAEINALSQTIADSGDATTLTAAESYADIGDATTLTSANSYTDNNTFWEIVNSILQPKDSTKPIWNKQGHIGIGSNYLPAYISPTYGGSPSDAVGLRIIEEINKANSAAIQVFLRHRPSTPYNNSIYMGIGGYNIVSGTNFNSTNSIKSLNFGNFVYFDYPSGSVDMDWFGIDVFGANANNNFDVLAKDIYGIRSQALINASCQDAYGMYILPCASSSIIRGNEFGLVIGKPLKGAVGNFQTTQIGNGAGTGIWFDGAERLYSDGTNLKTNCIFNPTGYKSSDGSNGITATITTAKLTSGGSNGSMTFKNGLLTDQTAAT